MEDNMTVSKEESNALTSSTTTTVVEIIDIDDEPKADASQVQHEVSNQQVITATINIDQISWKFDLQVGDLVDVRDPNGTWYQACVMLIEDDSTRVYTPDQGEKPATEPMSSEPEHKTGGQLNGDVNLTSDQQSKRARLPSKDEDPASKLHDSTGATMTDGSHMVVSLEEIYMDESKEEENIVNPMQEGYSPMDIDEPDAAAPAPIESDAMMQDHGTMLDMNIISNEFSKSFRIAYLGLPEKFDEWIALDSDRIERLNSRSFCRRGENPIREEVLFVIRTIPAADDCSQYTVLRDSCFLSPYYQLVINTFANCKGFENILSAIKGKMTSGGIEAGGNGVDERILPSLDQCLGYVVAVGNTYQVLSKALLEKFGSDFLQHVLYRLTNMTLPEIRLKPMESLDIVFKAVENLSFAINGRNAASGKCFESIWLEISLKYLQCPFLNRRLGGLRLLSELAKRAGNAKLYPSGLKESRLTKNLEMSPINPHGSNVCAISSSSSETANGSSTIKPFGPALPPHMQASNTNQASASPETEISFKVIPVLYDLTIEQICLRVMNENILYSIFVGDLAHGSLMERVNDILKAVCSCRFLTKDLVSLIWDTAYCRKEEKAWRVLKDLAVYASVDAVSWVFEFLDGVSSTLVSIEIVDLACALASRTRNLLLKNYPSDELDEAVSMQALLPLNMKILDILWSWCSDDSNVSGHVVNHCIQRFDDAVSTGISSIAVTDRPDFPWDLHWVRCYSLIMKAIESIRDCVSVIPAIKIIMSFIMSWPGPSHPSRTETKNIRDFANVVGDHFLYTNPCRSAVVKFIELSTDLSRSIISAIINLKQTFDVEAVKHLESLSTSGSTSRHSSQYEDSNQLSSLPIPRARILYKDYLSRILDFFFNFIRYCDDKELTFDIFESIWKTIVNKAKTSVEVEAAVSLTRKITLLLPRRSSSLKSSTTVSSSGDSLATSSSSIVDDDHDTESLQNESFDESSSSPAKSTAAPSANVLQKRYICSPATLSSIFVRLLCDREFISSLFYNDIAYVCTEKLFILINSLENLILEFKNKSLGFSIIGCPSKLLHWEIFIDIALLSRQESVALKAIKFVCSFPQKLSVGLSDAGEIAVVRKNLTCHCMLKLHSIYTSNPNQVSSTPVKRCLLILNEILEEAAYDSRHKFRPHAYLSSVSKITMKISSMGKLIKYNGITFDVSPDDSVDDLLEKLFSIIDRKASEVRVLFRAKDLVANDRRKLICQLGNLLDTESIMPVDKAPVRPTQSSTAVNEASNGGDVSSTTQKSVRFDDEGKAKSPISMEDGGNDSLSSKQVNSPSSSSIADLPAVILADTTDYLDLLFKLLDISEDSVCDEIWSLLGRLPSSPTVVMSLIADDHDVTTSIFSSAAALSPYQSLTNGAAHADTKNQPTLSRLLYVLNVVDYLLQPAASAEKMSTIQSSFGDIPGELFQKWPSIFIARGGHAAVFNILKYVQSFCPVFLGNLEVDDATPFSRAARKGYSQNMLISAMRLAARLVRSFVIRSNASTLHSKGKLESILAISRRRASDQDTKPIDTSKDGQDNQKGASSTVKDSIGKSDQMVSMENGSKPMQVASATVDATSLSDLLKDEWGWRLQFIEVNDSTINSEPSLIWDSDKSLESQDVLLRMMVFIRFFSRNLELFGYRKYVSNAESAVIDGRSETIVSIMHDLFAIWLSILSFSPTVILRLTEKSAPNAEQQSSTSMDITTLCQMLLFGEYPKQMTSVYESSYYQSLRRLGYTTTLETRIGLMFPSLFKAILSLINDRSVTSTFHQKLLQAILTHRPHVSVTSNYGSLNQDERDKYQPLFDLMKILLQSNANINESMQIDENLRLRITLEIVSELKQSYEELSSISSSSSQTSQVLYMEGTMDLLASLLKGFDHALEALYNNHFLSFLIQNCLGLEMPSKDIQNKIVLCQCDSCKDCVYTILNIFCEWKPDIIAELVLYLRPIHSAVPTPSQWGYDIQSDALSSTGYVGLRNMGCTCYMNGLLQALFMIHQFRDAVLSVPIVTHGPEPASSDGIRNSYIAQLQKMFLYLQYSKRKAFSPDDWVYCYKDETGVCPINVMHQQDAQEFLQVLFDRLETSFSQTISDQIALAMGVKKGEAFSKIFGGVLCDQMLKDSPVSESKDSQSQMHDSPSYQSLDQLVSADSIRERTDSFICISVDVKGSRGLEESLNKFIQGEQISDYLWDEKEARVTITKRQCIAELADNLIFHLKRFELNFDTFMREKVNDAFSFPQELDMYPYTRDALMDNQSSTRDMSYYHFELKSVVVHTGTADSGHYFSYVKETKDGVTNWYEFNDSVVKDFQAENIQSQCFGGNISSHTYVQGSYLESSEPNPQSAYMLIYQRVAASSTQRNISAATVMDTDETETAVSMSPMIEDHADDEATATEEPLISFRDLVIEEIERGNMEHSLSSRILSPIHINFTSKLLSTLLQSYANPNLSLISKYIQTMLYHLTMFGFRLVSRSSNANAATTYLTNLSSLLDTCKLIEAVEASPATPKLSFLSSLMSSAATISPTDSSSQSSSDPALLLRNYSLYTQIDVATIPSYQSSGKAILSTILDDVDNLLIHNLFTYTMEIRQVIAQIVFILFKKVNEIEGCDQWFTNIPLLRKGIISSHYAEAIGSGITNDGVINLVDDTTDDLQLAISLSQQDYAAKTATVPVNGSSSSSSASEAAIPLALKLLLVITSSHKLQMVAEFWRKSDSMTWLILQCCRHHWTVRAVFINRDVVAQLIDIFLGDQSPLIGILYDRKGRKFAQSSYVNVYPIKAGPNANLAGGEFALSSSTLNIPNWTALLDTVSVLINAAQREDRLPTLPTPTYGFSSVLLGSSSQSTPAHGKPPLILSEWDLKCVNCKTFYSTCIRQSRYAPHMKKIIAHRAYLSIPFSELITEVFFETLSVATVESTAHVFELVDAFLTIDDTMQRNRCMKMFSPTQSGVLDLLSSMKDQQIRAKLLCVSIWSVLSMTMKNKVLADVLSIPRTTIETWAPWMLQFCFQFLNRCAKEQETTNALAATSSNNPPTAVPSGPYLVIFGEKDEDRELPWIRRADQTFQRLQMTITAMGGHPDLLMPESAFVEPATPEVSPRPSAAATSTPLNDTTFDSLMFEGLADGMSDEELAKVIAQLD
jgi:ubiquitin C-terminal hydrolase